jgi:hypothetical protein
VELDLNFIIRDQLQLDCLIVVLCLIIVFDAVQKNSIRLALEDVV